MYETGPVASRVTRLLPADGTTKPTAEFAGRGAAFSPDGSKIAYLKLPSTAELAAAQAAVDSAAPDERAVRQAALTQLIAAGSTIVVRDVASGGETSMDTAGLRVASLEMAADGTVLFAGTPASGGTQIYAVAGGRAATALTSGAGDKTPIDINSTGTALLYSIRAAGAGGRGGPPAGRRPAAGDVAVPEAGRRASAFSRSPTASRSRSAAQPVVLWRRPELYLHRAPGGREPRDGGIGRRTREGGDRAQGPRARGRSGALARRQPRRVPDDDARDRLGDLHDQSRRHRRSARDARHPARHRCPVSSRTIDCSRAIGEPRHRRSFLYDLPSMTTHAPLPQQHGADDRARVRVDGQRRTARSC